jgi:hypothetical protein
MAVHTYIVNPLTVELQTPSDVLWNCTGTADGISFNVTFWQSAVQGMTLNQIKLFAKSIIDNQVFPVLANPSGALANFSGGTFTG